MLLRKTGVADTEENDLRELHPFGAVHCHHHRLFFVPCRRFDRSDLDSTLVEAANHLSLLMLCPDQDSN